MVFLNAVREVESLSGAYMNPAVNRERLRQAKKYFVMDKSVADDVLQGVAAVMSMLKPEVIQTISMLDMFGDFDGFFKVFLNEVSMHALARESGVRIKKNQTVINPWPFRVTGKTTKEEFHVICNDSTTGHERYMEFEKAG